MNFCHARLIFLSLIKFRAYIQINFVCYLHVISGDLCSCSTFVSFNQNYSRLNMHFIGSIIDSIATLFLIQVTRSSLRKIVTPRFVFADQFLFNAMQNYLSYRCFHTLLLLLLLLLSEQNEYLSLVEQCMNFACELMDLCRGTQEVEAVLSEGGDRENIGDPLARLKMAMEYEEKKVKTVLGFPCCEMPLFMTRFNSDNCLSATADTTFSNMFAQNSKSEPTRGYFYFTSSMRSFGKLDIVYF